MPIGRFRPTNPDKPNLHRSIALLATILPVAAYLAATALPASAADLNVTSGTFIVTAPGDVPEDRVVVDNTADQDATLQINSGVTFSKDIIVNNGGLLINEGSILRSGASNHGVTGDTGSGRVTNQAGGTITSDETGILLTAEGTVLNTGAGTGINGDIGVEIQGAGSSLVNADGATIHGATTGADIFGDITNTGTGSKISGGHTGARTQGGATLRNEDGAGIEGTDIGVEMYDGGDVHNSGGASILASGAASTGVEVWIYGSVTNSGEGSSITGGNYAVTFNQFDIDSVFALTNSDKATINGDYAGAAFFFTEGTVLNEGGAEITANSYGIMFEGGRGELVNETGAAIYSLAGTAIDMDSGGSVTNRSGGVISGVVAGLLLREDQDYTVINTGAGSTITAMGSGVVTEADAIYAEGAATITNSDGASISGLRFGAWMKEGGIITNTGEDTLVNGDRSAIRADEAATIINRDGANATGGSVAISLENGGSVTNSTGARISATNNDGVGVVLVNGGTLDNQSGATIFGTFRGVEGTGADITNTGSGSAITSDGTAVQTWAGGGSVTNADGATMHGGENGILLDFSTELLNEGGATIIGDTGMGALSFNGGIITNTGEGSTIRGATAGIWLQGGPGTVVNTNGASIVSENAAIALLEGGSVTNGAGSTIEGDIQGIYADGGTTSLSNAGHIAGDVALSADDDNHVTLYTGGSIDGNLIINDRAGSALTFDGADDQFLSDAVTGDIFFGGLLTKQGTGTWTIDKDLVTGETHVTAGGLIVGAGGQGTLTGDVHVSFGARLGGSGTIFGNVVADGEVAPGNSPGVLNIVGDYTQTAGSTFVAEIDTDSGLYDQINVSGMATIDNGAILNINRTGSAPYQVGTQYVFLSATGGVTGSYIVTGDLAISPFLALADYYGPDIGYLQVEQVLSLNAGVQDTSANQLALATAIQTAGTGPVFTALTNLPSLAALGSALQQLTGEIYPSIAGAMLDDSRLLRNAAIGRLQDEPCAGARPLRDGAAEDCRGNALRFWGNAIGAWANSESEGGVASMNRMTGGVLLGMDTTLDEVLRVGVLAGYGMSDFDMKDRASSAASDDYHLGVYAGTHPGQMSVKLGATRTWHHVSANRTVDFAGLRNHLDADYHARTTQLFGEASYRIAATKDKVEPFVNIAYADNRTGDFSESGGAAALTAHGGDTRLVLSTLGVHLSDTVQIRAMETALKGTLGWRHASGDTTPRRDFEIDGSGAYRIDGLPVPRHAMVAKASAEVAISENTRFGLSGDMQLSQNTAALGLQARLEIRF